MSNNEELHVLMKKHKLGRRDVARLVGYPIAKNGQAYTVNNWLSEMSASGYRNMPDSALMLLKLRLANLTEKQKAAFEGPLDKAAVLAKNRLLRKCFQNPTAGAKKRKSAA